MKIEKVLLSRTIPTGPYMNDKIGMEATVEDGDTPTRVLNELLLQIDQWHRQANPHLYQEEKYTPIYPSGTIAQPNTTHPVINLQDEKTQEDYLVNIQTAVSLDELKTYKIIASSDPTKTLYTAYCERLKELSI